MTTVSIALTDQARDIARIDTRGASVLDIIVGADTEQATIEIRARRIGETSDAILLQSAADYATAGTYLLVPALRLPTLAGGETQRIRLDVSSLDSVSVHARSRTSDRVYASWEFLDRAPAIRDVGEVYGESASALSAAYSDADSTESRKVLKIAGQYDVDSPGAYMRSDVALVGDGGVGFNQTSLKPAGNYPAIASHAVETDDGGDGTIRTEVTGIRLNAANNTSEPVMKLRRHFTSVFRDMHISPGSTNNDRQGVSMVSCDAVKFINVNSMEFPTTDETSLGSVQWDVDSACTDISWFGCQKESTNNSRSHTKYEGKGLNWHGQQWERVYVTIDGPYPYVLGASAGQCEMMVGPKAVQGVMLGPRAAYGIGLFHPFITLAGIEAGNMTFSGMLDFTGGRLASVDDDINTYTVTALDEVLFGVLAMAADGGSTAAKLSAHGPTGVGEFRGTYGGATLSDINDDSTTLVDHAKIGLWCAAKAYTGETSLSFDVDGTYCSVRAWKNILTNGMFRGADGSFSTTGWSTDSATLSEQPPWHSSQAVVHPDGAFTSSGTTVTGQTVATVPTAFTELTVGHYLYSSSNDEFRKITAITDDDTLTIASAFTADVVTNESVAIAEPWCRVAPSGNGYNIRQASTTAYNLKAGKRYMQIAQVWANTAVDLVANGNAFQSGVGTRKQIHSINPSQSPIKLDDGSVIMCNIFDYGGSSLNRFSLGNATFGSGVAADDAPRVKWMFLIPLDA